jgi:energy-coupling factor transporter ATP-binding protein EcfA2
MKFTADGLTVIFGDNGSGKSGYARITKKMCRSLSKDDLLGNIFEDGPKSPAEIVVSYQSDGAPIVTDTWIDGAPTPVALSNIGVFDSANARLYVDKQNRITYLPREISLLQEHSAHCTEMDDAFKTEINSLQKRLRVPLPSGYSKNGSVGKVLALLDAKQATLPNADSIRLLAQAEVGDDEAVQKLEKELANDPAELAARTRRFKTLLNEYAAIFANCVALFSYESAKALQTKKALLLTTAEAAGLAATEQFAGAPLEKDIGSGPWRLMFEHAKAFAKANGAPDDKLPDAVGDHCALCQEPLTDSAAARVKAFNEFVTGEATKAADAARKALDGDAQALRALRVPSKAQAELAFGEYAAMDDKRKVLAAEIAAYSEAAIKRREALGKAATDQGTFDDIPELAPSLLERMTVDAAALDAAAAAYDEAAKNDIARSTQRAKLDELRDRKKLAEELDTVLARLDDLQTMVTLKKCIEAVGTAPISRQITSLRRSLIMRGLKEAITKEIVALDLSHIPFEINDKSVEGQSLIAVDLKSNSTVENSKVLSEGEQRALAVACFLAETATSGGKHGLVIDDPVSSLDHGRIRRVAARIVGETAAGKQLIVFTHNILFYNELIDAAARLTPQVVVHRNFISKTMRDGFGLISEQDEPWVLMSTSKRIDLLGERLKPLETEKDFNSDGWRRKVTDFYTQLRETWERLVEEVLLGKVVERFNSDVRTMSLKGVVVDDNDYKTIYFAMKRASERSGHDMAGGRATPLPTPDDMKKDLEEIRTYRAAAAKRKQATEKVRKALEEPPRAVLI